MFKKIKLAAGIVTAAALLASAGVAFATTVTFDSNSVVSDGALSLNPAAASALNLGSANTSGSIAMGAALTSGSVTVGGTSMAAGVTTIYGGTDTTAALKLLPGTAGAIVVGATAGTGSITMGSSTAAQTVNISNGINGAAQVVNIAAGAAAANTTVNVLSGVATAGTQTLNLGTGASVKVIHIGDGAAANVITIGSQTNAASLTLQSGTGGISLTPVTSGTIVVGATAGTGSITMGSSTAAQTVNISNGINGAAQVVNIAASAVGANSTVNILSGVASAGVQTLNMGTGATPVAAGNAIHIGDGTPTGSGYNVITIGSAVTTAGNGVQINGVLARNLPTAPVSFSAAATATAAQIVNAGIFVHPTSDNNARQLGLPTAVALAAAMPGGDAAAGDTVSFVVASGINTVTIDLNTGITFGSGETALTVPTLTTRVVTCRFTSGSAAVCY